LGSPHDKKKKKQRNRAIHSCPSPDDEDDDDHNGDKCSPPDPTGAVCREPKRKRERMDLAMAMSLERMTKDDEDTTTLNLTEIHDDEVHPIAHALGQTTHLRMLAVAVEWSSRQAIAALIPHIRGVASLRTLQLYSRSIQTSLDHRLLESINPHVRTLLLEKVCVTAVAISHGLGVHPNTAHAIMHVLR
jgi:hypothetical protein